MEASEVEIMVDYITRLVHEEVVASLKWCHSLIEWWWERMCTCYVDVSRHLFTVKLIILLVHFPSGKRIGAVKRVLRYSARSKTYSLR